MRAPSRVTNMADVPTIIWPSRAAALCYDAPAMPATVIRDTTLITCNPERAILRSASIAIEGDRIAAIGGSEIAGSYPHADVVDGRGKAVLPGLINSHTHVWYTVARGIQEDFGYPPIVPTAVHDTLSAEELSVFAVLGAIECIRSGSTTLFEIGSRVPDYVEQIV